MTLLGGCQTFIGVLATLIVLCVIFNESNFLCNILQESQTRLTKEINNVDDSTGFEDIISAEPSYKLLIRYLKELKARQDAGTMSDADKLALAKAGKMELKVHATFSNLKAEFSNDLNLRKVAKFTEICNTKEQVLSPFYTLLSCLMVFWADELTCEFPQTTDYIITFLSFFFIFSLLFWTIVWIRFWNRTTILDTLQNPGTPRQSKTKWPTIIIRLGDKFKQTTKQSKSEVVRWLIISIVSLILYSCFLLLPIPYKNIETQRFFVFCIGLILPLSIIAIRKSSKHNNDEYTYGFCLKHFLGLCSMAIFFTIITVVACSFTQTEDIRFTYQCLFATRFLIQISILFSGLILPVLIPYRGFKKINNEFKSTAQKRKSAMLDDVKTIISELNTFCQKEVPIS